MAGLPDQVPWRGARPLRGPAMSEPAAAPLPPSPPSRSLAATRDAWAERLARFPNSGLSPAQFCAQGGVSLPSFYSWKRRLTATGLDTASTPAPDADAGPR